MRKLVIFMFMLASASAYPQHAQRIVGGSLASIEQYPEVAALLHSNGLTGHQQACGGTILTNFHILTAAQCTYGHAPARWRSRLGSSYANYGGSIFDTEHIINHLEYKPNTLENDISIIRLRSRIVFNELMRPGTFAGSAYYVPEDQPVVAVGWGRISTEGPSSERLRQVQVYSVNQDACRQRYATIGMAVTDDMLCTGVIGVGGRDQCMGDSGGPVFYHGHVAGITSWGFPLGCGDPWWPSVNVRLQRYPAWINANLS